MAESLIPSTSAVQGSEAVLDIFCDPCHQIDGKFTEPAGYCKDCEEHLCSGCLSHHKRTKPTRHHQLEDAENMPSSKHQGQPQVHTADDKCHLHKAKRVLYICQSHNQLCCKLCVSITHRRCSTELISKKAANIDISKDSQTLKTEMTTLQKSFSNVLTNAENQASTIRACHSTAIEDINKLKEAFDELRNKKIDEADTIKEEDSKKIESVNASCKVVIEEIDDALSGLDMLPEIQNKEKAYITMFRIRSHSDMIKASLTTLEEDTEIRKYSFLPDENLRSMLNRLENIGKFSHESNKGDTEEQKSTKSPHYIKNVDFKCSGEAGCSITGMVIVSPDKLLIADCNNKSLKIVDTKQDNIVSKLALQDSPWSLSRVTDQRVVVTLRDNKKILFVTTSGNNLSTEKELSVSGQCRGIAYNENDQTLIVTFVEPKKVDIMNLTGTVIKRIDTDTTGAPLFARPEYVAFDSRKSLIYVSDCSSKCVISITLDGTVTKTYCAMLNYPEDLYVLQTGIVYVVDYGSNTVVKLVPGGDKFEPLMYLDNGPGKLHSIAYCEHDDNMFVGMYNASVVKKFQMK